MSWKVESDHVALLAHSLVVHDAVVLTSVAACCMQEDDILIAFSRLLIEDFAFAPERRLDVDISADDVVHIHLSFGISWSRTRMGIVNELEDTAPAVRPVGEARLVTLDLDALLLGVHAEHPFAFVSVHFTYFASDG